MRISQAWHQAQLVAFEQLIGGPITVNRAVAKMTKHLGFRPGWRWTRNRLEESGFLMGRLEAMRSVRCVCGFLTCPFNGGKCPKCGKEVKGGL